MKKLPCFIICVIMLLTTVGCFMKVDAKEGDIGGSVISSFEWNTVRGIQPDMVRLGTSEYYLIAAVSPSGKGWVNTIKVWNNNGTIRSSNVSNFQFDAAVIKYPTICHVSGDVYAIVYQDNTPTKMSIATITAWSSNGTIKQSTIDTLDLTYSGALVGGLSDFVYVTNNIFVVSYINDTDDEGILETVYIDSTGNIGASKNDTAYIDGGNLRMTTIDSNTVAIVSYDSVTVDGILKTYNISSTGDITNTPADTWTFATAMYGDCNIQKIAGNTYAIVYSNTTQYGILFTTSISSSGDITPSMIDTQIIDTNVTFPSIYPVISEQIYAVAYSGLDNDGYVKTINISSSGIIGNSVIDSLEFDIDDCRWYPSIAYVSRNYFLIVYPGKDTSGGILYDGWSCTIQITTGIPMITSMSPSNLSTGITTKPTLTITVSDREGNLINITWLSNSSGSWLTFGHNNSVPNGTYRQRDKNFTNINTSYWWRVNITDGVNYNLSSIYKLTTFGKRIRFVQMTDTHIIEGGDPNPTMKDGRTDYLHADYIGKYLDIYNRYTSNGANNHSSAPEIAMNESVNYTNSMSNVDFVIFGGDNVAQPGVVNGTKSLSLIKFKSIADRLTAHYHVLGAHFHDSTNISSVRTYFETLFAQSMNESWTDGGNLFIKLSELSSSVPYYDVVWLTSILESYKDRHMNVFIFGHTVPLSGLLTYFYRGIAMLTFTSCLTNYSDNYDAIVFIGGHNHANQYVYYRGVHYMSTTAVMNYPTMVRIVDVYDDHIEIHTSPEIDASNVSFASLRLEESYYASSESPRTPQRYMEYSRTKDDRDIYIGTSPFLTTTGTLNVANKYYSTNKSMSSATKTLFNITADNIIFNMNFRWINSTNTNSILIDTKGYDNIIIRNGYMSGGNTSIFINGSSNVTVDNIKIYNASRGVVIFNSDNCSLSDIQTYDSTSTSSVNGTIIVHKSSFNTFDRINLENQSIGVSFISQNNVGSNHNIFREFDIELNRVKDLHFTHISTAIGCKNNSFISSNHNTSNESLLVGDSLIRAWFFTPQVKRNDNHSIYIQGVNVYMYKDGVFIGNNYTSSILLNYTGGSFLYGADGEPENREFVQYINNGGIITNSTYTITLVKSGFNTTTVLFNLSLDTFLYPLYMNASGIVLFTTMIQIMYTTDLPRIVDLAATVFIVLLVVVIIGLLLYVAYKIYFERG